MLDLIRRREKCSRDIHGLSFPLCWGVPLIESHKMHEDATNSRGLKGILTGCTNNYIIIRMEI
jgi:hypothetical protein